tara:strand:+ start:15015 stop:15185 length:171 start_codon:yes stop_codon:yes gene_type:complete
MKVLKTQLKRIFVKKIVNASRVEVSTELKKLREAKGITVTTKNELLEIAIRQIKGA